MIVHPRLRSRHRLPHGRGSGCGGAMVSGGPTVSGGAMLLGFHFAGAAEDVLHRIVSFVAGVFVDWTGCCHERILKRELFGERGWIVDGGAIQNGVRVYASEALDDVQVLRGTTELDVRIEIG